MWKLDFLMTGDGGKGGLPPWMRPNVYRTAMLMENQNNGSTFEGASTTEDAFRGGRKSVSPSTNTLHFLTVMIIKR